MDNFKTKILNHNNKILNKSLKRKKTFNCREKPCPLNKNSLTKSFIYKAIIATDKKKTKTHIGSKTTTFKDRYRIHKISFNNRHKRYSTELLKYLWELKITTKTTT